MKMDWGQAVIIGLVFAFMWNYLSQIRNSVRQTRAKLVDIELLLKRHWNEP